MEMNLVLIQKIMKIYSHIILELEEIKFLKYIQRNKKRNFELYYEIGYTYGPYEVYENTYITYHFTIPNYEDENMIYLMLILLIIIIFFIFIKMMMLN